MKTTYNKFTGYMKDSEFIKELDLREARLKRQLAAINEQLAAVRVMRKSLPNGRLKKLPAFGIADAVRKAIAGLPYGEFTLRDVAPLALSQFLPNEAPSDATLGSAFWQVAKAMIDSGELAIKAEGKGRKPAVYSKVNAAELLQRKIYHGKI
jgi:hypothetical protein